MYWSLILDEIQNVNVWDSFSYSLCIIGVLHWMCLAPLPLSFSCKMVTMWRRCPTVCSWWLTWPLISSLFLLREVTTVQTEKKTLFILHPNRTHVYRTWLSLSPEVWKPDLTYQTHTVVWRRHACVQYKYCATPNHSVARRKIKHHDRSDMLPTCHKLLVEGDELQKNNCRGMFPSVLIIVEIFYSKLDNT